MAISSVYTLAINARGELIAEYSYDEWGKLLDITTAQENNAEQLAFDKTKNNYLSKTDFNLRCEVIITFEFAYKHYHN